MDPESDASRVEDFCVYGGINGVKGCKRQQAVSLRHLSVNTSFFLGSTPFCYLPVLANIRPHLSVINPPSYPLTNTHADSSEELFG